jgi:hypothetical protein
MSKIRVAGFSISVDGFGAGPHQRLEDPLGQRGPELFCVAPVGIGEQGHRS